MYLVLVLATTYLVFGVTKTSAGSLDQFWADDFKAFEKIYGRTNDKHIYGATLPPPISFEGDLKRDASDKKESYYFNDQDDLNEPFDFGDSYKDFLTKNPFKKHKTPTFIGNSKFKTTSKSSDPETYNFLKHLDEADREQRLSSLKGGYRPYYDYAGANPEDTDAFRSIQEILDAHENKKSKDRNDRRNPAKSKKPSRAYNYGPSKGKFIPGRRTRINTIRVRKGPYVKNK
ncbi:hypothetical protein K1T71_001508 [Dendrolimus kikuchii]|uniref:Uncharacterized protein n=1 Tax=Dendrolimus kikuchii TaxID=765133 RepID=A0ACC1DJG6_9NEOP|nr:hypothetical protein K1T71_001508 [Dendrolimus kikuchii]